MSTSIRRGIRVLLVVLPVVLAGCARTSTAPVGADTIEITVHVGTICDGSDAERLARRHAAVETIRRGFDDYVVVGSFGGDHMADEEPATARTTLSGSSGRTLFPEETPPLAHPPGPAARPCPEAAAGHSSRKTLRFSRTIGC